MLPPGDHDSIRELLQQTETVDLAIPRGGEGLIRFVQEHARVPVIAHAKGVCHLFVDGGADVEMATRIVVNASSSDRVFATLSSAFWWTRRTQNACSAHRARPSCGGVRAKGCERTCSLVPEAKRADEDDWGHEYLDRILAVRVVDGFDAALGHVAPLRVGSHGGHLHAQRVRSCRTMAPRGRRSCVVINASTRLHDGGEFGLGAELGTATSKLHWRGRWGWRP